MSEDWNDCDDWDDWENSKIIIPTINVLNQEQLKRLEERKLIEEADTEIAKELFATEQSDKKIYAKNEITKTHEEKNIITKQNREVKINKINKIKNQMDNELKQREHSKKIIQAKLKKQREIELYGEPEEIYEYDEYDSLYHS